MGEHFFQDAPVVSWKTWTWRKLWPARQEPHSIQSSVLSLTPPKPPANIQVQKLNPQSAAEYSRFLNEHYYFLKHAEIHLDIPPETLIANLSSGRWMGIEVRNENLLLGVVFSHYAGSFRETPMGLITWLCVHSSYRKKGFVNLMLRSLYALNQPTTIYWWRTDGWLQSPCPPVDSQSRIIRKTQQYSYGRPSKNLRKLDLYDDFVAAWKRQNPNGIALYTTGDKNPLVTVYEYKREPLYKGGEAPFIQLAIQPTYEFETRTAKQGYYEILGWITSDRMDPHLATVLIEYLLDEINLGEWYEAPATMPHNALKGWKAAGMSSWSVMGLDPGTAASLPILPLSAA
jgi:hypothetical protein